MSREWDTPNRECWNKPIYQILKAIDYAKKEYKDIYTLETLIKILTK